MSLPDAPVITGTSQEVFDYYKLNAEGIAEQVKEILQVTTGDGVNGSLSASSGLEPAGTDKEPLTPSPFERI